MKKAYNQTWIDHLHIQQIAEAWREKKLLTEEQAANVEKAFPQQFYRPGIFVKIGLFIFTLIACSFASGLVSLFLLASGSDESISAVSLFCMAGFVFFLEYLIKTKRLYHSGVDNALLYSAMAASVIPFFSLFDNLDVWQYCIILFAISLVATLRYADLLTAAGSFVLLMTVLANIMMKFPLGKALLPFAVMILSAAIYLYVKKNKSIFYHDCRKLVEVLSLATFYLGGNYLVVREGNALLSDIMLPFAPQIPFAPLFYFFTIGIPVIYIFFGLRKKDRVLFIIGLLSFAFSIFTYRYYFAILTVAQGLAVSGMLMITLAVSLIKYLHTPKHGLSDEQEGKRNLPNLEAILVAQHLGQTPQETGSVEFGGGNFGGGGAGEAY
ncbi:hypothetical protein [Dyadobacter sp. CY326]|uniref:hypothetical protein n=1 Tax=Dyadobacter sp. CY326 TaxID=2907300 RepID=UPI001F17E85B|nr:hypothetical protein [Dyadobacter sp. CY326]MCE7066051.1 hypothetical protein [Dyadobacter sp. CY326]